MSDVTLVPVRFHAGHWEGELHRADDSVTEAPDLIALHQGEEVAGLHVVAKPGDSGIWTVRFAVPMHLLHDGLQTFLFCMRDGGEKLGDCVILTGSPLSEDIRAEVALLRAELELMKRVLRRVDGRA